MKIKLIKIEGCKSCNQVLLHLDITEYGEYFVQITAWHTIEDVDYIQQEAIEAETKLGCERIIADYSEPTANEFANSFQP